MSYFTPYDLDQLRSLEGKRLEKVLYTIWKNLAHPDGTFEVLEWVELLLGDGTVVGFTTDEEAEGILLGVLDFGLEKQRVKHQFGGQVALERVDMGPSPTWQPLMGRRITAVGLLPTEAGGYPSSLVHLIFGKQRVELALNQEGLLVTSQ